MKLPRKHLVMCCCLIAAITLVYRNGISHFVQQRFLLDNGGVDKILSTSTPLILEVKTTSLLTVREIQPDTVTTKDKTTIQSDKTMILSDKTITRPNHLIKKESATTRRGPKIDSVQTSHLNPITTSTPSVSLHYRPRT